MVAILYRRTMELKKGELARIADFSATGKFNQTNVLVTVVSKPRPLAASFLPLTVITFMPAIRGNRSLGLTVVFCFSILLVDYLHKASAYGKIPTNFLRRDLGSSNYEVLVSRMIDRSIRPLFETYLSDIQVRVHLPSPHLWQTRFHSSLV